MIFGKKEQTKILNDIKLLQKISYDYVGDIKVIVTDDESENNLGLASKDIEFKIKDGTLFITKNLDNDVTIYLFDLKNIKNKGAGSIKVVFDTEERDYLDVDNRGVGDVSVSGNFLGELNVYNEGAGNVEINIETFDASIDNNGVGDVTLKGSSSVCFLTNNGAGGIDATQMNIEKVFVSNNGVGTIKNSKKVSKAKPSKKGEYYENVEYYEQVKKAIAPKKTNPHEQVKKAIAPKKTNPTDEEIKEKIKKMI